MGKRQLGDDELLLLGKKLQDFYDSGYVNRKQTFWFTFVKGVLAGFGAFLGGTVAIALLLWFLSLFNHIPFIDKVSHSIEQGVSGTTTTQQ